MNYESVTQATQSHAKIFSPQSLHELMVLYYGNPDSLLFAGGTHIMTAHDTIEHVLPNKIISMGKVEELKKVKRYEKYIEIGSMVTYSKILSIGRHVIPRIFYDALSLTSIPSVRNLATIGGNLCVASPYSTLYPALFAIDAAVEVRNLSGARWIPISRFVSRSGKASLKSGNLVTKIRIPTGEWDIVAFEKIGPRATEVFPSLIFAGLARIIKGVISDIRFSFGACGPIPFRSREFEIGFSGFKLPFEEKEIELTLGEFEAVYNPITDKYSTSTYRKKTASRLIRWFLAEVSRLHY
jgi:xanthine dehydrogenase FAD-binding subunit